MGWWGKRKEQEDEGDAGHFGLLATMLERVSPSDGDMYSLVATRLGICIYSSLVTWDMPPD